MHPAWAHAEHRPSAPTGAILMPSATGALLLCPWIAGSTTPVPEPDPIHTGSCVPAGTGTFSTVQHFPVMSVPHSYPPRCGGVGLFTSPSTVQKMGASISLGDLLGGQSSRCSPRARRGHRHSPPRAHAGFSSFCHSHVFGFEGSVVLN